MADNSKHSFWFCSFHMVDWQKTKQKKQQYNQPQSKKMYLCGELTL